MSTRPRARVDLGTFVVFTCLVSGACATAQHDRPPGPPFGRVDAPALPALGAPFSGSDPPAYLQLTSSGSLDPAHPISVRGVRFDVAVSQRDGTVVYESTSDPAFRTPENIHVGSGLADVLAAGAPEPMLEQGWAFWTTLPSGWHAAFVSEPFPTGGPLSPNATVRWLFRR